MRLLLINPKLPESFWSFKWAIERVLPDKRAINPPLGLATLAALCPAHWHVEIIDENIEAVPASPRADLIGVCAMGVQFPRQRELLRYFRAKGYFVVAGGSYASLCPEHYTSLADAVVAGEAEYIWPQFCADFEAGRAWPLYREQGVVDLADSPVPRFDLLKLDYYSTLTLQFSRGCPYRCEFCDIIVMFGRKPRCKSPAQIERELDALRLAGGKNVFFVDDNLIGNRPKAKALLQALVDYQVWHGYAFRFGTEVSINLARDAELLTLMRAAHFEWVFVGIESPDARTLKEARKTQNTHEDALTSVKRIYAQGIDVLGGFIVGFDNDTAETFDRQYRFIVDSGIQAAMVGLLTALPKTPLYRRLAADARLRVDSDSSDNTKLATNIVPKQMSYQAMIDGYRRLYQRLTSDEAIARRIRNKVRYLKNPLYAGEYCGAQQFGIVLRLLWRGLLPGGLKRIGLFLSTIALSDPRKLPLVVVDWICGLAMRDFVRRHFDVAQSAHAAGIVRRVNALRLAVATQLNDGRVSLRWDQACGSELAVTVGAVTDRRLLASLRRHLDGLLKHTPSTLILDIGQLANWDGKPLLELLRRLARYGDRVSIIADERIRSLVPVDWARFNWVLPRELSRSVPR